MNPDSDIWVNMEATISCLGPERAKQCGDEALQGASVSHFEGAALWATPETPRSAEVAQRN
jgi:hypothetical protein